MDIISFNEASTANDRISKVNANPDSNSGIVTVPSVIATGDSVTIPVGRTAVLPNVQVDGELVVDGEVFVPSGATFGDLEAQIATKADKASPTFTGDITLSGTGNRIRGDFSNATDSNRVIFQDSTNNAVTVIATMPNGTAKVSGFNCYNSSDVNNASYLSISAQETFCRINAGKTGTGSYLPVFFNTSNAEAMRIDTNRNVLVTGAGGLGYGTGSGGTVTQLTSKSTAVTLNKPCGTITMHNASLAAGASVSFTLFNNLLSTSGDNLLLTINNAVSGYNYKVDVAGMIGGVGAQIRVTNISGSTLSESLSLDFAIIKGATA